VKQGRNEGKAINCLNPPDRGNAVFIKESTVKSSERAGTLSLKQDRKSAGKGRKKQGVDLIVAEVVHNRQDQIEGGGKKQASEKKEGRRGRSSVASPERTEKRMKGNRWKTMLIIWGRGMGGSRMETAPIGRSKKVTELGH